ncbi:xanthine dehydrogenase family protein molybdopterin-binding subunit [Frigidibacter sp. ROC022]|uniref:xanthine dehydrogenase family protein molybdopterin-binding subunit n=1 Tax=Frigidibacter sp. ROC022 TaxID=2971796 RepID=UPI00215A3C30|nr:xanthine dehydrogenase family protein molybdopterin-binding subunit [Frigidibacter sp. ROC022]MCR8723012.1 xanthine dehydrogenase family protein molybdopterin-binding subunit [Frigidibacter sp. ROC022]
MDKFGKSAAQSRVEDLRLLTGHGRYVDDIAPENAWFVTFVRSPFGHARILGVDTSAALAAPGVKAVLTVEDLEAMGLSIGMTATVQTNRDGSKGAAPLRPLLAKGKVNYVGEAVAAVVAETLVQAKDAAELVEVDYEDLPAKIDLAPGGPTIHDEAPDNVAYDFSEGDADKVEAAIAAAAHVVTMPIGDNRIIVNSMEPRGCYAEPMEGGRLHVCVNGQGVWGLKNALARVFGEDAGTFRVTNPDVGGGFGMKGFTYPEYYVCAAAARKLDHPVRWMSERTEAMLTDNGGRAVDAVCTLAFDKDHKITAYKVEGLSNLGAYNSEFGQMIQSFLWARVLMGTYDVQTTLLNVKGIYTNTVQVDAYRGAGRPEAIYALERMMDYAARQLGTDPWTLRRKNFIPVSAFPYTSATGEKYDVGDFNKVLSRVEIECDRAGFPARRAASASRGKLRGQGLCYYIESILGSPEEDATVEFQEDGTVLLYVGTQSGGQGHETVFAKFLSDQTGIPLDSIRVIQGDSDRIARGGGTGGSRSVTTQNNATLAAVTRLVSGFGAMIAEEAGVDPAEVSFDDERFRVAGSNLTPTMLEAAEMARAKGRDDLLKITETATLPGRSYPNGGHVCEVEVDPATGQVTVERYTVVDDFGNLINPMLAEGQVHGGVAQGLGQALSEQVVYDENGQLLTATFMDYGMPRAADLPLIDFTSEPVPSTANIMGMKGCGEAGTVGSMAAVANAVMDALWQAGVRQADMPFTPHRVWAMLNDAKRDAA